MQRKIFIILIIIFLTGASLGQNQINHWFFKQTDSVTFLKVGQGDAILLTTVQGARVLVDGGPDNSVIYQLGYYLPLFCLSLDAIFVTHADLDHVLGVIEVMRRYKVKYFFITEVLADKYLGESAVEQATQSGVEIVVVGAGDVINLPGLDLTVLWPDKNLIDLSKADANDTSIVLRADFTYGSVMLTGDVSVEVERKIIELFNCVENCPQSGIISNVLDVDVLKAGHHGSRSATSPEFVVATSPQLGVISAGLDNKFNHPHPEVLNIFSQYNVQILDNFYNNLQIEFSENGLVIN